MVSPGSSRESKSRAPVKQRRGRRTWAQSLNSVSHRWLITRSLSKRCDKEFNNVRVYGSDGCFHTVASHTNTVQKEQNCSGFFGLTPEMKTTKKSPVLECLPSSSREHLVDYHRLHATYHYLTTRAPCALPYLKSLRDTVPLGSGHENGGIHRVFYPPHPLPFSKFSPPPPTQFWCSSLTTVIFVATTVTTTAEEKLEIWWIFPVSHLRAQSSPTSPSVCTPARMCDYGGNVSHEECVSQLRDQLTGD